MENNSGYTSEHGDKNKSNALSAHIDMHIESQNETPRPEMATPTSDNVKAEMTVSNSQGGATPKNEENDENQPKSREGSQGRTNAKIVPIKKNTKQLIAAATALIPQELASKKYPGMEPLHTKIRPGEWLNIPVPLQKAFEDNIKYSDYTDDLLRELNSKVMKLDNKVTAIRREVMNDTRCQVLEAKNDVERTRKMF